MGQLNKPDPIEWFYHLFDFTMNRKREIEITYSRLIKDSRSKYSSRRKLQF